MTHNYSKGLLSAIGMIILILDTKTALASAAEGISLCIYTVIPSLFPFIFLSSHLTNALSGIAIPFLRPINQLCGIPQGSESYFLIGILGGYPTGAACIANGYEAGHISRSEAEHLLGFCSNAGPAFLFGMASRLFASPFVPWILWGVHVVSALLSGYLLKSPVSQSKIASQFHQKAPRTILSHSLFVMASICGWVLLFRIIIGFFSRWFLWLFPLEIQCMLAGILELSNGCCALSAVSSESTRFLILCCLLAFGGICVTMQTVSVVGGLSLRKYILGKLAQTVFSLLLSLTVIPFITQDSSISATTSLISLSLLALFLLIYPLITKKTVAIQTGVQYNVKKL